MKSLRITLFVLIIVVTSVSATCAARITEFELVDLDGNAVNQEILKNAKLTVFNVWGTYCPPCLREMPDLGELAREMKDEGVQFIGLLTDWKDRRGKEDPAKIKKAKWIVKQTKATYPHLRLTKEFRKQLGEFRYIPQTYFVLQTGYIVRQWTGANGKNTWRDMIRPFLANKK